MCPLGAPVTDRKLSNILHTEEQICLEISLEKKVTSPGVGYVLLGNLSTMGRNGSFEAFYTSDSQLRDKRAREASSLSDIVYHRDKSLQEAVVQ